MQTARSSPRGGATVTTTPHALPSRCHGRRAVASQKPGPRTLLPLALLAALLALVPAAAAEGDPLCIIFFEPSPDFRLVDVNADLILTPDQRANLSARVDADADGNITPAEVSTFENATVETITSDYGERLLNMDGLPPRQLTVWTKLRNWTGPVEEARKGVVTEMREYHMTPAQDETGHLLTGGLYARASTLNERRPVIETIVLTAPDGWVVWEVSHAPKPAENATSTPTPHVSYMPAQRYEQQSVTISAFDIREQYEVVFAKEGEHPYAARGSPGPALALVLPALAAAALVGRWKTRP